MDSRMLCGMPILPHHIDEFVCSWKSAAAVTSGMLPLPAGVLPPYRQPAEPAIRLPVSAVRSSLQQRRQHHADRLGQRQHQQLALMGGPLNTPIDLCNELQSAIKVGGCGDRDVVRSPSSLSSSPSSACSPADVMTTDPQARVPVTLSSTLLPPAVAAAAAAAVMSADDVRRALFAAAFDCAGVRTSMPSAAVAAAASMGGRLTGGTEHLQQLVCHGLQAQQQQRAAAAAAAAAAALYGGVINGTVRPLHPSIALNQQNFEANGVMSLKSAPFYMHDDSKYINVHDCVRVSL